jgi:hypothetical protein
MRDDPKLPIASEFLISLCHLHGRPVLDAVKTLLLSLDICFQLIFMLFTIITKVEDSGAALIDAFKVVSRDWVKCDLPMQVLLRLVPSGKPVPHWAVYVLKESAGNIQYGARWGDENDFAARVIPAMSLEDSKTFLATLYPEPKNLQSDEWVIVASVFRTHSEAKKELMDIFPIKKRPPGFYWDRSACDAIYGRETEASNDFDSD